MQQHQNDQKHALAGRTGGTALCEHVWDTKHKFDFDSVETLDRSNNYTKLKYLEMLNICNDTNSCNKRTDISSTIAQYQGLLDFLKSKNLISN